MSEAKIVRWGILATGYIAKSFVRDLTHAQTRANNGIVHKVVAVASSSSLESAENFIAECVQPRQDLACKAYGSYSELIKDAAVDITYIATPHSLHYQNCMLCLEAGKSVLCEKPLVINADQARMLSVTAKKRNVFLMEALWTRCLPVAKAVRQTILDGKIGEVLRVTTDLSIGMAPEETFPISHRMVSKDLAGGALLDLGIYNLSWIFDILYNYRSVDVRKPPKFVGSTMSMEPRTGVDEETVILLEFPKAGTHPQATGIMTTGFRVNSEADKTSECPPTIRIQGDAGEIQVFGPIYRPTKFRTVSKDGSATDSSFSYPENVQGMMYEADEAGQCMLEGKLSSEVMPLEESIAIMGVMDEARTRHQLQYPEEIETTRYPL